MLSNVYERGKKVLIVKNGNPVNLMVFVRNYGWDCQQGKGTNAKGELKLAVTPNCPGLWNMTLDAFN